MIETRPFRFILHQKPDQHDERAKAWALLTAMKHCAHRIPFKVLSHPSIDYFRNLSILPPSKLALDKVIGTARNDYINGRSAKMENLPKECGDLSRSRSIGNDYFNEMKFDPKLD
eukprot:25297_1